MKPGRFEYHRPASVAEAVELKASYDGEAAILAGGQSLVPMLNFRLARPRAVVDINGIAGAWRSSARRVSTSTRRVR